MVDPHREGRFPRIGLVGVVLIGVALVEAAVGALAPSDPASLHGGHDAHILAFVGMVLVLAGVLRGAAARSRFIVGEVALQSREDSRAVR